MFNPFNVWRERPAESDPEDCSEDASAPIESGLTRQYREQMPVLAKFG